MFEVKKFVLVACGLGHTEIVNANDGDVALVFEIVVLLLKNGAVCIT